MSNSKIGIISKPIQGMGGVCHYIANLAEWFNSPIYMLRGELPTKYEEVQLNTFGRSWRGSLPQSVDSGVGDLADRIEYSTWRPPDGFETIITTTFLGKLPVLRSHQRHIHLAHGFHRGAFGLPPRNDLSSNSLLAFLQKQYRPLLRLWEKKALLKPDELVANSQFTSDCIEQNYGIETDSVVHPPVRLNKYGSNIEKEEGEFYLFIGRLAPAKGVLDIVQAFEDLPHKLVIAGDGPLLEKLQKESSSNVDVRGYVSENEKIKLLSESKGFIQNSVIEEFGITTIESLASGTPVLARNHQNNPYLITDGENGVLFDSKGETEAIIQAVKRAEEMTWNQLRIQMSAKEYSASHSKDSWEKIVY